ACDAGPSWPEPSWPVIEAIARSRGRGFVVRAQTGCRRGLGSQRPLREGHPERRRPGRDLDRRDRDRGRAARMADADGALAPAWDQDADGLPEMRSEPRCVALDW